MVGELKIAIPRLLDGIAKMHFEQQLAPIAHEMTFEQLLAALKHLFTSIEKERVVRKKLKNLYQQPGESFFMYLSK